MRKLLKNKIFLISAAAAVMVSTISVPKAMAYFTTYVTAKGGYEINLGTITTIKEEVKDMTKHIVLTNTGDTDCFVRVKVFSGSTYNIQFTSDLDSSGKSLWTAGEDGYWYYRDVLTPGQDTKTLLAKITVPEGSKESFNVVVVQESAQAVSDESGNLYADWNVIASSRTDSGVNTGEGAEK